IRTRLGGATVALARAVPTDREEAGSGLQGLARGGLLEAPGVFAAPAQALGAFAALLPEWAERLPGIAPAGGTGFTRAFGAVLAAALDAGPVVLALDDAHTADRASLQQLAGLLRDFRDASLTVVLGALPQPPREELDEIRRRLGHDSPGLTITLAPLDGDGLRALAAAMLPGCDAAALERVSRRVASDSAGLPLLAVELLSAVAHGMDLEEGASAWPSPLHTLNDTLPADLPEAVVAALRTGVGRLSGDAQKVLAAAALQGERVTIPALARMTGLPLSTLQAALDELEWQRWLEADGQGYGFVAGVARRVVADHLATLEARAPVRDRPTPRAE
ncbi:MAG: hypothetical protein HOP28_11655, partial [Gemmatimonadales bacterium]|nr:hypothetical protein [Gemmatimonadales bacterium]